jgi:predicted fused transcriptional regulator/phosphomethylpyrimidine kinase
MNETCYLGDKFIHECSSKLVYELGDFGVDPSITVILKVDPIGVVQAFL